MVHAIMGVRRAAPPVPSTDSHGRMDHRIDTDYESMVAQGLTGQPWVEPPATTKVGCASASGSGPMQPDAADETAMFGNAIHDR